MIFCFHDWSKWSDPIDTSFDCTKVQARHCLKCNKCEVKKIKQPWNIWFASKAIEPKKESKDTNE